MPIDPAALTRIAVAQIPAKSFALEENLNQVSEAIIEAMNTGVELVVMPECAITGYIYDSFEDTFANAVQLSDPIFTRLAQLHRGTPLHSVIGFLEREGEKVYNTAILITPDGIAGTYRKQHLPFLAADRFVTPGNRETSPVFQTALGNIGIMICFDLRFPECARELALQGADIIAMPTNWAGASTILADLVVRVRALENLVFLAVSDRSDAEHGMQFIGRSQIITPHGEVLVDAGAVTGVFSTVVALHDAREKKIVINEGAFELPIFAGRRPELYVSITDQATERLISPTTSCDTAPQERS